MVFFLLLSFSPPDLFFLGGIQRRFYALLCNNFVQYIFTLDSESSISFKASSFIHLFAKVEYRYGDVQMDPRVSIIYAITLC
jgi:hypothetical protein